MPGAKEQGFIAQATKRRAQRPGQAQGVFGIFQSSQEVQQIIDFLLREEGSTADDVVVQTLFTKGFFIEVDLAHRPEEEDDVALAHWPQRAFTNLVVRYERFLADHCLDPTGNPGSFAATG